MLTALALAVAYSVEWIVRCLGMHFLSSALAGLLAYSSILIISWRAWPELATSRRWWYLQAFAYSCALCAAITIHWYADLAAWGF